MSPQLSSLSVVEVQLVMHCLDQPSLLSLARCSHHMRHAAASNFAFKFISPITRNPNTDDPGLGDRIRASLLRYADTALQWGISIGQPGQPAAPRPFTPEVVAVIHGLPRIREVDMCGCPSIDRDGWDSLLSHESMRSLVTLKLGRSAGTLPPGLLGPDHLPHMRTLHLWSASHMGDIMSALPGLHQLTSLLVVEGNLGRPYITQVAKCAQLRRLTLGHLRDHYWGSVLDSQNLVGLRSLTLGYVAPPLRPGEGIAFRVHSPPVRPTTDWGACFTALRNLRNLSLHSCPGANSILRHAGQALKLVCLRVRPVHLPTSRVEAEAAVSAADIDFHAESAIPAPLVIISLLVALPELRYILQLLPLDLYEKSHRVNPLDRITPSETWHLAYNRWTDPRVLADAGLTNRVEVQLRSFGAIEEPENEQWDQEED